MPAIVVLMGVSGSGKTTIGTLLAERMHAVFADADDFHTDENKAKMAAGIALTDADREPWLLALSRMLQGWFAAGKTAVLACSALKESYRGTLGHGMPAGTIHFVLLDGPPALIAARLQRRTHAYMLPSLLSSQLDILEPPVNAFAVINDRTPELVVSEIMSHLTEAKT